MWKTSFSSREVGLLSGLDGIISFMYSPPVLADGRAGNRRPAFFIFDLAIAKKLTTLVIKEYRILQHSVALQDIFQLGPDRRVSPLIFLLHSSVHQHDESLAFHNSQDRLERTELS